MHNFLLFSKTRTLKNKSIFHTFGYNTLDYLFKFCSTEGRRKEWGKEEKVFLSTRATLPSEERVLLQFHIQAFSSARQCLLRSTEAALTVALFYPTLALSDRVMVWLQAAGLLWLWGTVLA